MIEDKMASSLDPVPVTSQKHDPAWNHCQMFKNGDRVSLKCIYCGKVFKGGGIHRIKEHLAGQKGNASTCHRVHPDIRLLMLDSLNGVVVKKRKKQKIAEEITSIKPPDEADAFADPNDMNFGLVTFAVPDNNTPHHGLLESQEAGVVKRLSVRKRRGRPRNMLPSEATETIPVSTSAMVPKRADQQVHMAVGRFLYDVGIPLDAVNSAYFQPMIDTIATQGFGAIAPSYHELRGWILKNAVEEVKNNNGQYMGNWGKTGCSLLADEWHSENGGTFMNISVYCSEGSMFLKSVDTSDIRDSPDVIYESLKGAVEEVGVSNVLQVVTCNNEPYVVAGNKLTETFPTLYWAPCAAQSVDLILMDFGKLEWINLLLMQAGSITRFIYNHSTVLTMMRRYAFGNDLVELGVTRFATDFVTLKRFHDLKQCLQGMVTSQEWADCLYSKKPGGMVMLDVICNESFWASIQQAIQLTDPLLRVLRIITSDRRPATGYIYAAIYRTKVMIKKEVFKKDYLVYWNIIDSRWEQLHRFPLHAAGFYLNPRYFYTVEGNMQSDIVSGMFDCVERLVPDIIIQDKIINEINSYKNAIGDFGRKMAIRARDTMLPAEWWSMYGGGCPNLSRLAVRVLSQSCSSTGQRQNQIYSEKMHRTRNCLEHQRLADLLFVQQNLHLSSLKNRGDGAVDPVSSDNISFLEDWIAQKNRSHEGYVCSDWTALDPPLTSMEAAGPSDDDVAELGAGFNDDEIFDGVKDAREETIEGETKARDLVKDHDFNTVSEC